MIASISGTILKAAKDHLVVKVGGVGLRLFVPQTVLEDTGGMGRQITLYTHLIVRETELTLYGFAEEEDLALFETVLTVNGVGPRVGLAILSTLSPELIKRSVVEDQPVILQRVPGIGKKTAERIIFQLKDKLDLTGISAGLSDVADIDGDVLEFLLGLGFSVVESQAALQQLPRDLKEIDARLQAALQLLGQ